MTLVWRCRATFDRPFRDASLFYVSCVPYVAKYQLQCSSRLLWHSFFLDWITAIASCLDSLLISSSVLNLFRTLLLGYFQNSTVRTHYPSAHQPSLAARPRKYLIQTGSYDVSIHLRHLSVIPTVMFHPFCRHDIQTTAAVFYLTSSGRSARSSVGKRLFWCHRLEWPASPRRTCAVTRGFQTKTQNLAAFPFYRDTIIGIMCYYYRSSLLSGHLWSVQ